MALHHRALAAFGGVPGVKDANALESALMRPRNCLAYSELGTLDLFIAFAQWQRAHQRPARPGKPL